MVEYLADLHLYHGLMIGKFVLIVQMEVEDTEEVNKEKNMEDTEQEMKYSMKVESI